MAKPVVPGGSGLKSPGTRRVAAAAPGRVPAAAPAPNPPLRRKSGYSGFLAALLVLFALVFAYLYYLAFEAEDTSDIAGYQAAPGTTVRNLKSLLAVGLTSGRNLTVTEEEVNRYLAATMTARQEGTLGEKASLQGIGVRLEDGHVEVVVEREVFGRRHTVSTHFTPSQETVDGRSNWDLQVDGGKYGKLHVGGQLLRLTLRPILRLGEVYSEELRILQHASSIRVEDGRILLGPVVTREG